MNLFFFKDSCHESFFFSILEAFGKLLGGVCQPLGLFLVRFCKHVVSLWSCQNHSFGSDGYGRHLGGFGRDLGKVLEMFGDSCQQA